MSHIQRFPIWRRASDLPVYRTVSGYPKRLVQRGDVLVAITMPERAEWQTQFTPWAGADYTDAKLTLDLFELKDDYEASAVACPCGEMLYADNVGDLLREIYKHCGAAGHPRPGFDR